VASPARSGRFATLRNILLPASRCFIVTTTNTLMLMAWGLSAMPALNLFRKQSGGWEGILLNQLLYWRFFPLVQNSVQYLHV
jgi:hypothetical protein